MIRAHELPHRPGGRRPRPPHLYRDVFGLEALMDLEADGGHGVILKLPAATLELADAEHGAVVDRIEVGRALGIASGSPCRWTTSPRPPGP